MSKVSGLCLLVVAFAACATSEERRKDAYDAEYQMALARCGQAARAFQDGYNAGYSGARLHGEWADLCVPQVREATLASYQDGFMRGAGNAPVRVIHTVQAVPSARRVAAQCTFDSDCGGGGMHCRASVCEGNGLAGDRCTFNDDCYSDNCFGRTCRDE